MGSQKEEWVNFDNEVQKIQKEEIGDDPLRDVPLDEEKSPMPAGKTLENIAEIGVTSHEETAKSSRKSSPEASSSAIEVDDTKVLKNGKFLANIFPCNPHCAWLTPPKYDTAKIHPSVASAGLSPEVYTRVMKDVTEDPRFKTYVIAFSRVLPFWVIFSIIVLLFLLLTSPNAGFSVMVMAFFWMCMLFLGIFFCIIIRKHLKIYLTDCIAEANKHLLHYNILIGVQDRGDFSCHKVVVIFMYYETKECLIDIEKMLRIANSIAKPKPILMTHDEMTSKCDLLLRTHIQPYIKSFVKHRLLFPTRPAEGVSDFRPKHCKKNHCLCQFVEEEYFNAIKKTWYEKLV